MTQDCHLLNWLILSTMVRTSSSTADFATSNECADKIPLIHPYASPLNSRIRGLEDMLLLDRNPATIMIAITKIACRTIHTTNGFLPNKNNSWSKLCAGSGIAPNIAISTAPLDTRSVPPKDQRVKGSPRIKVAHIELKTRPDACSVDSTGNGNVVIWIVLPTRFEIMNIPMPSCHRRRL